MTAKVVAVVNQKGGVGKTTISMNLAAGLQDVGFNVLLVDADPQESTLKLTSNASTEMPFPTPVVSLASANSAIPQVLKQHLKNYDVIVIDGPPSHTAVQTRASIASSDLVLIPITPAPGDLLSTVETCKLVSDVDGEYGRKTPSFVLVNRYEQTTISKVIVDAVEEKTERPLMQTKIGKRTVFVSAPALGLPARALGDKAANAEVDALVTEVLGLLGLIVPPAAEEGAPTQAVSQ